LIHFNKSALIDLPLLLAIAKALRDFCFEESLLQGVDQATEKFVKEKFTGLHCH
jgi:hypothetical protein